MDKTCRTCRFGRERPQESHEAITICAVPGLPKERIYDPDDGDCASWKAEHIDYPSNARPPWAFGDETP